MSAGRVLGVCWFVVGFAAVVVGLYIVLTDGGPPAFGWFAYTPTADARNPLSGIVFLDHRELHGAVVGVAGLIILASGVGYCLGHYGRRDESPPRRPRA